MDGRGWPFRGANCSSPRRWEQVKADAGTIGGEGTDTHQAGGLFARGLSWLLV